jgi:hypothetical protein
VGFQRILFLKILYAGCSCKEIRARGCLGNHASIYSVSKFPRTLDWVNLIADEREMSSSTNSQNLFSTD